MISWLALDSDDRLENDPSDRWTPAVLSEHRDEREPQPRDRGVALDELWDQLGDFA